MYLNMNISKMLHNLDIICEKFTARFFYNTHCVLLRHYYSVDFPWWFDRKISFSSLLSKNLLNDKKSKLHFAIWQKTCFRRSSSAFKSIWRPTAWMDPVQIFFYYISFYSFLCRLSCFYREWLALIQILMI